MTSVKFETMLHSRIFFKFFHFIFSFEKIFFSDETLKNNYTTCNITKIGPRYEYVK